MKSYKPLLEDIKYNILLEMSSRRRLALNHISNQMASLFFHLIAIEELGKKDKDYKHHVSEIEGIKRKINRYNRSKNKPKKKWFSINFIKELIKQEDYIEDAIDEFIKRYKYPPNNKYESLENFTWFNLFE